MLYIKHLDQLAADVHHCESTMGIGLFFYLHGSTVISIAKKYGVQFTPEQQLSLTGIKAAAEYSRRDVLDLEKEMRFFGLRYRGDMTVLRKPCSVFYTLEGIPRRL